MDCFMQNDTISQQVGWEVADACLVYTYLFNWSENESEVAQSCPTLCDPMDCSLPGSSLHGILQARVLEWVAISFSRGSSWRRDLTRVSRIPGRRFSLWATNLRCSVTFKWFSYKHIHTHIYIIYVVVVQSLSRVWLFATPQTAEHQAFLSFTISQSWLKFMPTHLVMPSNCLILFLLHLNLYIYIYIFSDSFPL